eukprot:CAMPEP_0195573864 /NCGR_PEP_ID=MMETSP0814-20130614/5606_1 /TAXON_ID=97485 /ORGANISM="Prymnesium parvum, Strain Texoma1" /LENGTH=57 /DNA_ID=CAMNT_0040709789 /DNA_START=319 /DNA_END=493 /DNA_ORIENTATION=-
MKLFASPDNLNFNGAEDGTANNELVLEKMSSMDERLDEKIKAIAKCLIDLNSIAPPC